MFFSFYFAGIIIPQRVLLSIMGFLALVNAYTMRITLSVAITQMVVKPVINESMEGICIPDDLGSGEIVSN